MPDGLVVAHLTSVHSPADPRVGLKECASLAEAGYEVVLVAPDDGTSAPPHVRLVRVPPPRSRLDRMTCTTFRVVHEGLRAQPALFHVHDPELLPWGVLLHLMGHTVVYDVHEDYVTSFRHKTYLPRAVRTVLAALWDRLERRLTRPMHTVLAEKYYRERFPRGAVVLNYPVPANRPAPQRPGGSTRVLYSGNVTVDRGALLLAELAADAPRYTVHAVGRCERTLAGQMQQLATNGNLYLNDLGERRCGPGTSAYVPFDVIRRAYADPQWLCGLAIFPYSEHYARKELTKFFEYMQAGLPIVCSDFPQWRALVEGHGIGICVPPGDPSAAIRALDWLRDNPAEAAAMGRRGRELVRTQYSWESQAANLTELYRRILAGRLDRRHLRGLTTP